MIEFQYNGLWWFSHSNYVPFYTIDEIIKIYGYIIYGRINKHLNYEYDKNIITVFTDKKIYRQLKLNNIIND